MTVIKNYKEFKFTDDEQLAIATTHDILEQMYTELCENEKAHDMVSCNDGRIIGTFENFRDAWYVLRQLYDEICDNNGNEFLVWCEEK